MSVKIVWDYLIERIGNAYGVAGLMGNLWAESGFKPTNLQNSYEKKLGMTDAEYTAAVDDGSYTEFATDRAGYGLAQWTNSARKRNLHDFAKDAGKSIGDLHMQLDFLMHEIQGYKTVLVTLRTATSVQEASDIVLTKYERPADQSDAAKKRRAGYGQKYFDLYATGSPVAVYKLGDRILRSGDTGDDVRELQKALNRLPNTVQKLEEDGVYGSETMRAVYTLQTVYEIEVDGKYGPVSHKTLMEAVQKLEQTPEQKLTIEEKVDRLWAWMTEAKGGVEGESP